MSPRSAPGPGRHARSARDILYGVAHAVTPEQWNLLVWYACAIHDDGRLPPPAKPMARTAGVTPEAAKAAWYDGMPHLGQPAIRHLRREISAGTRPWPAQPPGAAPAVSRLATLIAKAKQKAPPPPSLPRAPAPPPHRPPPPPPPPRVPHPPAEENGADPWGGQIPDDVAGAIGDVPFPDEAPPLPPTRQVHPKSIPSTAHAAGHHALREAARDRVELDPAMAALIEQATVLLAEDTSTYADDTPLLPTDAAHVEGAPPLPPIDRERIEHALLESRLDSIDLAARARRGVAMGVYAVQLIMSGAVPLAKRVRREAIALARQPEKVDLMEAMTLLDRATRVARSVSTVAGNVMTMNKSVTDDLRVLAKALDGVAPAGSGEGGELTDEELAVQMQAEEERLARDRRRLERKMQGGGGGGGMPPASPGSSQSAAANVSEGAGATDAGATERHGHVDDSSAETDAGEGAGALEEPPAEDQETGDDGSDEDGDHGGGG